MSANLYIVHALASDGSVLDDEGLNDSYSVADHGADGALRLAHDHLDWLASAQFDGEILAAASA